MFIALIILAVALAVLYKKERARIWLERIILFPLSYIIGHFLIMGRETVSYTGLRDFSIILANTVLIYCAALGGLSLYHAWRRKKKEKENDCT